MKEEFKKILENAKLNPPQKEAVDTVDGPLLILAGAGSGKTRVLTYRMANLIENYAVAPYEILAITFTNKAAKEMKERVANLIGQRANDMWISTFHAACCKILRREIDKIGYNKNFTIYDGDDQKSLVKQCMKELNINEKDLTEREILNKIGNQKDNLMMPKDYLKETEGAHNFRERKIAEVYELYQKKLKENNALDFDDIIMKAVELFRNNEEVLAFYQRKFKYIMVDEYQDTNRAQYTFVKCLAQGRENLCVVGDDDQCIYTWRGADIRNILEFEKDFKNTKVIKLEQNYRSKGNILKAANDVIRNNFKRKDKTLKTESDEGEKIRVYRADSDRDEAFFVAKTIEKIKNDDRKLYKDFAILYRTNAQSRAFEENFIKKGMPYRLIGGQNFYQRKEIKDILAYLRVINNPLDEVSLRRIINVPKRNIGDSTLEKVNNFAKDMEEPLFDALMDIEHVPSMTPRAAKSIASFTELMHSLINVKDNTKVSNIIAMVLEETSYTKDIENSTDPQELSRLENLDQLITSAMEFEKEAELRDEEGNLANYLEGITLVSDIDKYDENADAVILMTLHSAKGLEFPVVFMPGMENGLFPGSKSFENDEEMEESRRLCYVGITRAKEQLYLISARSRYVFGHEVCYPESEFLNEIDKDLIEYVSNGRTIGYEGVSSNEYKNTQFLSKDKFIGRGEAAFGSSLINRGSSFEKTKESHKTLEATDAIPGKKVRHSKFGIGTIISVNKDGKTVKLKIAFENMGIKDLMLDMAPLEAI